MVIRYLAAAVLVALTAGCGAKEEPAPTAETTPGDSVMVPEGRPVTPEGTIGAGEWADARQLSIRIDSLQAVTVHIKYDAENLAVRFTGVNERSLQVEPEVLLDLNNSKDSTWQADDLLLRVGYQDCEGRGRYDSLHCGPLQRGWFANNFPVAEPGIIEMKISLARLGLAPGAGGEVGLALAVCRADGSRAVWPLGGDIARPVSWGTAGFGSK